MMLISWKLSLVMLAVVPPVCIGSVYYGKAVQRYDSHWPSFTVVQV